MNNQPSGKHLTLQERWKADEDTTQKYGCFELVKPPCQDCKYSEIDNPYNCKFYSSVPWDIVLGKRACTNYEK